MSAPRYGPLRKVKDRGRGRRDGRDCVPSLVAVQTLAETGEAISAPYPDVLLSKALHEITVVHQRFERQVDDDRAALAKLRKDWALAGEALVRTAQLVVEAHAALTEEELRPRSYDELIQGNGHKARSRSDRRRDHRIAQAIARQNAQLQARDDISSRTAVVEERIRNEFAVAQADARALSEHYATRVQAYWEHNVHIHPEGVYIAAWLHYTAQLLPSWVLEEPVGDPADLGRGPFELHRLARQVTPPVRRTGRKQPITHPADEIQESP
ncbi:hypothetical protein GCM10011609_27690 [Lentzea pudingi]|uniref:Uncharacterized protein n=1 Tax=Lentzea pudingi TaxID=1789439 RepID=A0ABQ2HVC7_9PSEU|nr:hypothetical protein [Lentzea pudingi]GGM89293.1 hypothetical protein GCM10011609_27690 [Lentzea pudingi]